MPSPAFVQQVETSTTSNPASITSGAITTTAANLLIAVTTYDSTQSSVFTSSAGETWTSLVSAVRAGGNYKLELLWANAIGGSTTFTDTVGLSGKGIYVAEYSNAGHYISGTPQGVLQTGPGVGANTISSGLVGSSGSTLLFGFCFDTQFSATAPIAGTSPIAFTGRTSVWSGRSGGVACATAEDFNNTGDGAATFGPGNQFNNFLTVAAAFTLVYPATMAWVKA